MWSKNKLKFVRSLTIKKHRDAEHAFLAEGAKVIEELKETFHLRLLVATKDFINEHPDIEADETDIVDNKELSQASALTTAHEVLAVFDKPQMHKEIRIDEDNLTLVLDSIQDPGNLGTIIRLADWFGITNIVCSRETADAFSPKVVQATMGALARVNVFYTNLPHWLESVPKSLPIYGTFMEGQDIYSAPLTNKGLIIMGNEGNGISDEVKQFVNKKLTIPNFPKERKTVESLNVAIATAITCSEFRRR